MPQTQWLRRTAVFYSDESLGQQFGQDMALSFVVPPASPGWFTCPEAAESPHSGLVPRAQFGPSISCLCFSPHWIPPHSLEVSRPLDFLHSSCLLFSGKQPDLLSDGPRLTGQSERKGEKWIRGIQLATSITTPAIRVCTWMPRVAHPLALDTILHTCLWFAREDHCGCA